MISKKLGTKAFSGAQNQKLQGNTKADIENSAAYKKAFGDQKLGDVLNKIADPSFKGNETRKVGNPELDKDAFFKLMLTQLQNQDPTNPLESHEMAAQLAHFSSIEQLNNMNATLKNIQNQGKPDMTSQYLGLIGKSVKGDSSSFSRNIGDKEHTANFDLMADAQKTVVEVKDQFGKTIKSFEMKDLKKGPNQIVWNGITEDGLEARTGQYHFEIKAMNNKGRSLPVDTSFEGRITGVKFVKGQPVLMAGNKAVHMKDVQEITQGVAPQAQAQGKQFYPINGAGGPRDVTPQDQVKKATGKQYAELPNNLESVKMSQGLINKVDKEVGSQ